MATTATPNALPPLPAVASTDPTKSPLDIFRIAIAQSISSAIPTLPLEKALEGVDFGKKEADFTVALPRFKLGGKPDEWGKKLADEFQASEYIESIKAYGAFVHYQARTETLIRTTLSTISKLTHASESGKPEYGTNDSGKGKKVIIEYSSPNIAKQFHVGHLRSTIIGAFLANLYKANGWEVISMNYLGDWGKQFGLIAVGFEKYGSEEELERDAIKHLYDVYVKINKDAEENPAVHDEARAYFKRMEDGDEAALVHWRKWRTLSIEKYKEEYARLNVNFDVYAGESLVGKESQDGALKRLEEMGLVTDSNGAKVVDLAKWKLEKAVVRKQDGTSIYLTRDIGGAIERYEKYKFDKMIYVVASQQDLHLAQFFKVLSLLEYPFASSLQHINFGMVRGMSTRKGTVVFLDDIIREAASVMHEQMKKNEEKYANVEDPEGTSREIGITAIKIQDMAAKRINDYSFNWSRMLSFEGDTGPYLQYAHVRLCSISRKNPNLYPLPDLSLLSTTAPAHLSSDIKAREIVYLLATYPEVVKTAMEKHEPSGVVTFAMRLAHAISSAWEVLTVKGLGEEEREKAVARLWLFESAREVLGASMRLLSLKPLERM